MRGSNLTQIQPLTMKSKTPICKSNSLSPTHTHTHAGVKTKDAEQDQPLMTLKFLFFLSVGKELARKAHAKWNKEKGLDWFLYILYELEAKIWFQICKISITGRSLLRKRKGKTLKQKKPARIEADQGGGARKGQTRKILEAHHEEIQCQWWTHEGPSTDKRNIMDFWEREREKERKKSKCNDENFILPSSEEKKGDGGNKK